MRTLRIALLSILLLGIGTAAFAQGGKCLPARTDGVDPYKSGEKIVFNISYNWHAVQTDVAKGVLTVDQQTLNGEKVWHTALNMQTAPFFDVFFKIRETFESWFALKGVEPRKFHRDSKEGVSVLLSNQSYHSEQNTPRSLAPSRSCTPFPRSGDCAEVHHGRPHRSVPRWRGRFGA